MIKENLVKSNKIIHKMNRLLNQVHFVTILLFR